MKKLFILALLGFSLSINAQGYSEIRNKLEKYRQESQNLRMKVFPTFQAHGGFDSPQMDSLNSVINKSDSISLVYVKQIVDSLGWLGKSQIGNWANQMLFLAIQHSDSADIAKYFPLLKASAEKGESDMGDMASMQDRLLTEQEKPQVYGTQSTFVDNKEVLYPIIDIKNVNKRRKEVGLWRLKKKEIVFE